MIEEGIAYWVSATKPNDTFDPPTYQCTLVVDKETAAKYEADGHKIKEIDEQPALFFKKYYLRPDGSTNPPVRVVDAAKNPFDQPIGNGSKIKVQFQPKTVENKFGTFNRLDLQAIQVIEHVPYSDGSEDEFDVLDGADDIEF
jgi:hypothetical protein